MGYVFGYGSLVTEVAEAPWGELRGWRRTWNVAMDNRAPESDDKFFRNPATGERPVVFGVWLNIEPAPGVACNGVALPVDGPGLRELDRRERNYTRTEVTSAFAPALGLPVWAYVGRPEARARFDRGMAEGRAFVSRTYLERVEAAFAAAGEAQRIAFGRTTSPPACPVRGDLKLVRC